MWAVIVHDASGIGYPYGFAASETVANDMADGYRAKWARVEVIFAETVELTSHIIPLSKWRIT